MSKQVFSKQLHQLGANGSHYHSKHHNQYSWKTVIWLFVPRKFCYILEKICLANIKNYITLQLKITLKRGYSPPKLPGFTGATLVSQIRDSAHPTQQNIEEAGEMVGCCKCLSQMLGNLCVISVAHTREKNEKQLLKSSIIL